MHIKFDDLKQFCKHTYIRVGVPEDEASIVSDLLAMSDLRGIETHGVSLLPIYILRLQKKYVRNKVKITYIKEKGPVAFAEAYGSIGHIVAQKVMQCAIEKAQEFGIGWITVKSSGHFGAAGLYSMMAANSGLIGYVCTNTGPMMAPFGGRERIIGNNPLSYAFPAGQNPPIVVDFSCSVVSAGRLNLARKKGEKIPLGWALDENGMPTEDPDKGYQNNGTLIPVGGHKGYGLALSHEILTAVLSGGKWSRNIKRLNEEDKTGIQGTCHSFMVLDPDCFIGREEFEREMDRYIKTIKESGKTKNADAILMPGEPELKSETDRLKNGIPLSANLVKELTVLGQSLGIDLVLMD
ncbi:Ldh family oxidoreductase [Thermodesulfobacteriota bacterium]